MLKSFRMFENQEILNQRVEEIKATLKSKGVDDLVKFGAELIFERIRDKPYCYAEFGVYWFAIKDILKRHGYDLGDSDDELMREEYKGVSDAHTIVEAEEFKDFYRSHFFRNTTHFFLEEDSIEWVLNDPEMASRVK